MNQNVQDGGRQLLLGKKLLERGIISAEQLRDALAERARSGAGKEALPLSEILLAKGFVTLEQLEAVQNEVAAPAPPPPAEAPPPEAEEPPDPALAEPRRSSRLGKYEILNELGRGGMGVVYAAVDHQLNRKVALKLMLSSPNADPKELALEEERFVREAQLSAKLKHPNIVSVYDAGVLDGRRFLSMELIEGQPFCDWRRQGSITLRQQVAVLRDVALAVHHAHEQGVLHRDLKPRNVLVTPNHAPFVTDFGLAKTLGTNPNLSLTASGSIVGTPTYMSPEQSHGGNKVDWRSDIWSLGIMLYEVLTGKAPFEGETPIEILMKVVRDSVVPPSRIPGAWAGLGLDATIENICLKALAKDPKDRYVTARAMADDLTKWLKGEVLQVDAPKPKRKPRKLFLVAGGGALAAAVAAAAFFYLKPEEDLDFHAARRFMDQGRFEDADDAFTRILGRRPGDPEAQAGQREARARKREKEKAELQRRIDEALKEASRFQQEAAEKARAAELGVPESERQKLVAERRAAEEKARLAEETARRLRGGDGSGAANPQSRQEDPWSQAVNLLLLIELPRDVVWGTWKFQDGRLTSAREPHARVEIPYHPPEEYDLRLTFSRLGGMDAVAVVLATKSGKALAFRVGAEGNRKIGFSHIPGAGEGPSDLLIDNHRAHTAVVQVRRDGVSATLDGTPVASVSTDFAEAAVPPEWRIRGHLRLALGSHESPTAFHAVELLEVTGKGRRAVAAAPPPLRPVLTHAGGLKPGLIGEYFYGTHLEIPARRRIDSTVAFRWGEGPAWPGGPADAFSCRWKGYLLVPRTGKYVLRVTADDGVRLVIDEMQALAAWVAPSEGDKEFAAVLERGLHSIQVEYFESAYLANMVLAWAPEGERLSSIGPESFFHDPSAFAAQALPPPVAPAGILSAHTNSVTALAFRGDGALLASAGEDRRVRLWDPARRKEMGQLAGHAWGIMGIAFGMDGLVLASAGYDKKIKLWDPLAGSEFRTLEGHAAFIEALAFAPGRKLLASGGNDRTIRFWDPVTGLETGSWPGHDGGVTSLAFSPDGRLLASGGIDQRVRLWEVESRREVRVLMGHADAVEGLVFTPDGNFLLSGGWDGVIRMWDVSSGAVVRTFAGHQGEVFALALSPDGKLLASGGADAMVRLWEVATGKPQRVLPGHLSRILALAFSPSGRLLASGGTDMTVRLWNIE